MEHEAEVPPEEHQLNPATQAWTSHHHYDQDSICMGNVVQIIGVGQG